MLLLAIGIGADIVHCHLKLRPSNLGPPANLLINQGVQVSGHTARALQGRVQTSDQMITGLVLYQLHHTIKSR
jgi:hypothetical protein